MRTKLQTINKYQINTALQTNISVIRFGILGKSNVDYYLPFSIFYTVAFITQPHTTLLKTNSFSFRYIYNLRITQFYFTIAVFMYEMYVYNMLEVAAQKLRSR